MNTTEKKDIHYLNLSFDASLYREFTDFCRRMGTSKTAACEEAVRMYMDAMNEAMSNVRAAAKDNMNDKVLKSL